MNESKLGVIMSSATLAIIFGVLFGISEALAKIPSVEANSIFELVQSILKKLSGN